jgi:shikimate kinase
MKRILYIGLNGYAGSGKDTVAKMLSHILNYSFSDKESAWDSFKRNFNPEETATFP